MVMYALPNAAFFHARNAKSVLYSPVERLIPPIRDLPSLVRLSVGILILLGGRPLLVVGCLARRAAGRRVVAGAGEG